LFQSSTGFAHPRAMKLRVPHPSDVVVLVRWVGDHKGKPSAIGSFHHPISYQGMTSVVPIEPAKVSRAFAPEGWFLWTLELNHSLQTTLHRTG
jgi:hypothetical protein